MALDFLGKNPVQTSLVLFVAALGFRLVDLFMLRLDERLGEIMLSKILGFALVLVYLRLLNLPLREMGLHSRSLGETLSISGFGVGLLLVAAYSVQWAVLRSAGETPRLVVAAIDPKTGLVGGLAFAVWLVLGNFVNSFMEEGLFRGVMLRHFMTRLPWWQANLLQAGLFAAWHLVWPFKRWLTGSSNLAGILSEAVSLGGATLISGYAYGYLYYSTGSLWAPWLAHTLHNTALNLFHIRTSAGMDADVFVMQAIAVAGLLPLLAIVKILSSFWHLPKVTPWGF